MPAPSIGRIVHYTLSDQDADAINRRRADFQAFSSNFPARSVPGQEGADGHMAHVGNEVAVGQTYPAVVVRVWDVGSVNLQVLLDGNDTYWATSSQHGYEPGRWRWPARV